MKIFSIITSVLLLAVVGNTGCQNSSASLQNASQASADTTQYTAVKWTDSVQNFGSVLRGKQVKIIFHVQNTGDKPLIISDARPSCGCTVANYTKSAIAPGQSGEVMANFDSNHGMPGHVHKTITVISNTNPTHSILAFEGEVMSEAKK